MWLSFELSLELAAKCITRMQHKRYAENRKIFKRKCMHISTSNKLTILRCPLIINALNITNSCYQIFSIFSILGIYIFEFLGLFESIDYPKSRKSQLGLSLNESWLQNMNEFGWKYRRCISFEWRFEPCLGVYSIMYCR